MPWVCVRRFRGDERFQSDPVGCRPLDRLYRRCKNCVKKNTVLTQVVALSEIRSCGGSYEDEENGKDGWKWGLMISISVGV